MSKKTDSQLSLEEKITLARTLVSWQKRAEAKRILNEVETAITEAHEDSQGNYAALNMTETIPALLATLTNKELPSGKKAAKSPGA